MKRLLSALTCLILLPALSLQTFANDIRYISDTLYVTLRSGEGTQYRILHRGLPSGTQLKLLEEGTEEGWSLMETMDGKHQGWVMTRYLQEKPTASILLEQTRQSLDALTGDPDTISAQLASAKKEVQQLRDELAETTLQKQTLNEELQQIKQVSSSVIDLNAEYQKLVREHKLLIAEADVLNAENEMLRQERSYNQWLIGAALVFLGAILTWLSQAFGGRKRPNTEWAN